MTRCLAGVVVFLAALMATARGGGPPSQSAQRQATAKLGELVEAYFRSDNAKERASLTSSIVKAADGSISAVAEAVRNARVWPALPEVSGRFPFQSTRGETIQVAYQLPSGYDPLDPHPTVVCLGDHGDLPVETFTFTEEALGESVGRFVLIAPSRPVGGRIHQPAAAGADLPSLLREARRRIHMDTERVFLFGYRTGGDAAWMASIAHPDLFAGVIVLSAYPSVPYPEQVYPFLLENLRGLPVLTVWAVADEVPVTTRRRAVAAHNRAIVALAERASLPIVGVEVPLNAPRGLRPPEAEVVRMLARRRVPPPRRISHWFRYPGQGDAGWLRQGAFKGNIWEASQLSILVPPTTDRDRFITRTIQDKLAYLGGRVDGQTITIETRRCARVDLMLPDGLVDFDHPVTVRCNGKRRHSGVVSPRISTLLETAYKQWEFQRLVVARLSIRIRSDGRSK